MIRQSAMHLQGRNAIVRQGGVDPHTSSGPIPVFVRSVIRDSQAGKYRGQQLADGDATSTTTCLLLQYVRDDFRFVVSRVVG